MPSLQRRCYLVEQDLLSPFTHNPPRRCLHELCTPRHNLLCVGKKDLAGEEERMSRSAGVSKTLQVPRGCNVEVRPIKPSGDCFYDCVYVVEMRGNRTRGRGGGVGGRGFWGRRTG